MSWLPPAPTDAEQLPFCLACLIEMTGTGAAYARLLFNQFQIRFLIYSSYTNWFVATTSEIHFSTALRLTLTLLIQHQAAQGPRRGNTAHLSLVNLYTKECICSQY